METFICNLVGRTRREKLQGREYIVAPVTMIVPGVLNGSKGPILYTKEANSKNPKSWNGVPLVVYHPPEGKSARSAEIMNSQAVGVVLNSSVDQDGSLKAEAWFDIELTRSVDLRVLNSLNSNEPIELSTGIIKAELKPAEDNSVFNGVAYSYIVQNMEPDHLAVLPDQRGACSLNDGCGVLINEESNSENSSTLSVSPLTSTGKGTGMDRDKVISGIIRNCDCWSEEDRDVLNGFNDEKLKSIATGQAKAIADAQIANQVRKGLKFTEGDVALNSEGEFVFNKKEVPEEPENGEGEIMNNAGVGMAEQPKSIEEFLASAPPEFQAVYNHGQAALIREKKALVEKLIVNVKSDEERNAKGNALMAKSTEELEFMVSLIQTGEPVTNSVQKNQTFDFSAASAPSSGNDQEEVHNTETVGTPIPQLDWGFGN